MRRPRRTAPHKLSNRQQEQRLRERFVSPRRVREWRDIHSQLHTVVAEHGWRLNTVAGHLRAGAPGAAGRPAGQHRLQERRRGLVPRCARHQVLAPPGRAPEQEAGRWLVAAELVETTRLFGRGLAAIEPQWIPGIAGTC
jgi:ATP-dependent helicase HrpA